MHTVYPNGKKSKEYIVLFNGYKVSQAERWLEDNSYIYPTAYVQHCYGQYEVRVDTTWIPACEVS